MIEQLKGIVGENNVYQNFPLKKCSSFGIGGEAKYYVTPDSIEKLFNLIDFTEQEFLTYKIIGNATNILFGDDGFDGLIISTRKMVSIALVGETQILASTGAPLTSVVNLAKSNGLTGLEFAVGIPGSVGGAIVMNAGAGDGDISKVLKSVTVLEHGAVRTIEAERLNFGYRSSYFLSNKSSIILFAEFELTKCATASIIDEKIEKQIEKRKRTQPQERSAGCVFKKCGEIPAGLLIDKAGLKGFAVGGAKVSEVHANFIVNTGNATARDVKKLIEIIKDHIWKKSKQELELEIEIID